MELFTTVSAERYETPLGSVFEVTDKETRYYVDEDAIDLLESGKYADDDEGDGYAEWCRDTARGCQVWAAPGYGITNIGSVEFFAAAQSVDDEIHGR